MVVRLRDYVLSLSVCVVSFPLSLSPFFGGYSVVFFWGGGGFGVFWEWEYLLPQAMGVATESFVWVGGFLPSLDLSIFGGGRGGVFLGGGGN